ncbi:hypothetical protein [Colwellia piezophila]|nr:hypothetical protein [Colwellia piezophila]
MTYIWTGSCWSYAVIVLDVFAGKVIVAALSTSPPVGEEEDLEQF